MTPRQTSAHLKYPLLSPLTSHLSPIDRGVTPEHEWEADGAAGAGAGAGKDDTAVIQFYSKEKDDDPRFQGFGVVKEVSGCACGYIVAGMRVSRTLL